MMVDDASQRTVGGSVTLAKPLGRNNTGSLSFTAEQTSLRDFASTFGGNGSGVMQNLQTRARQLGYANSASSAAVFAQNIRRQQLRGGAYLSVTPTITH